MEWEGDFKTLRWVIIIAIGAIVVLAIFAGLYGWYLYKTAGTTDTSVSTPTSASNPTDMQTILKTLTPPTTESKLSPEEDAKIRASMTPGAGAQAHPVDQATLDSLTPPVK